MAFQRRGVQEQIVGYDRRPDKTDNNQRAIFRDARCHQSFNDVDDRRCDHNRSTGKHQRHAYDQANQYALD